MAQKKDLLSRMREEALLSNEEITEALADNFKRTMGKDPGKYFGYVAENDRVIAQAQLDKVLNHKVGSYTLSEIIDGIEKGKVAIFKPQPERMMGYTLAEGETTENTLDEHYELLKGE